MILLILIKANFLLLSVIVFYKRPHDLRIKPQYTVINARLFHVSQCVIEHWNCLSQEKVNPTRLLSLNAIMNISILTFDGAAVFFLYVLCFIYLLVLQCFT